MNQLLPAIPIFYFAGGGAYDLYNEKWDQYSDNVCITMIFYSLLFMRWSMRINNPNYFLLASNVINLPVQIALIRRISRSQKERDQRIKDTLRQRRPLKKL